MKNTYLSDAFFGRLETLALNLSPDLAGFFGGKHRVRTYGQTVEFADYREYRLGDDIRRIDWNLYSRLGKYFLKLFTDERQMQVQIFLDCSASMGKDHPNKGAYSVAVAAALGFLAVHNMDKVSFNLMKGDVAENELGTIVGKNTFFRAISQLEDITFSGETDIGKAVTKCETSANDGLSVIISDFFTDSDWKKAVDYLTYKKRQVLLIQVVAPEEADPLYSGRFNLVDSESVDSEDPKNLRLKVTRASLSAYLKAFEELKQNIKSFCHSREAQFITVNTDVPIERMLFGELLKIGIMQDKTVLNI